MVWSTVSVTMSLLVGLSMTRLLTGLVAIFRARDRAELDWIPIAWTLVMLVTLLETWMSLNFLPKLEETFSFGEYLGLGGTMMLLYAAAALLLPPGEIGKGESLKTYFSEEGRFALPIYALFLSAGAIVNVRMLQAPVMAPWLALDIPLIILPIVVFVARSRRAESIVTGIYVPLFILDLYVSLIS
ncbi:MAG: hypothetical protein ABWY78_22355 [Microvirga sp.]